MTLARLVTLLVWMAVGISAVAWWQTGVTSARPTGPVTGVAVEAGVAPADWSPLLRASASGTAAAVAPSIADAGRFRLLGVAGPMQGGSRTGVALLSIDGCPVRALKAGQTIDGPFTLLEINAHEVRIGRDGGPATITLRVPLLPPASTGVLPGS